MEEEDSLSCFQRLKTELLHRYSLIKITTGQKNTNGTGNRCNTSTKIVERFSFTLSFLSRMPNGYTAMKNHFRLITMRTVPTIIYPLLPYVALFNHVDIRAVE